MCNEPIKSGTKSNGQNLSPSKSGEKETQQQLWTRETVALNCYEEPVKISWNELRVEIVIDAEVANVIFQGREALQIIRWFQSL